MFLTKEVAFHNQKSNNNSNKNDLPAVSVKHRSQKDFEEQPEIHRFLFPVMTNISIKILFCSRTFWNTLMPHTHSTDIKHSCQKHISSTTTEVQLVN